MTTICALSFVGSLLFAIITVRGRNVIDEDYGIDWRLILPMIIGGIGGGLCISGVSVSFLITYPISIAFWFFLFMAFSLE